MLFQYTLWFVCLCSFDEAMQTLSSVAGSHADDLFEMFVEMRGHLYLHAATLLLKLAQDGQQTWRAIIDLAALCYLLAYQVLMHQPASVLFYPQIIAIHKSFSISCLDNKEVLKDVVRLQPKDE